MNRIFRAYSVKELNNLRTELNKLNKITHGNRHVKFLESIIEKALDKTPQEIDET